MKEVDPKQTSRSYAFDMWLGAPMPMVTIFKKLNVTPLLKLSRRHKLKFNMLLCYCIGKAASQVEEFYILPVGKKLFLYDNLAVNTIVANSKGGISSCDIPFRDKLSDFNQSYMQLTEKVRQTCENHDLTDQMVIGTSALVQGKIEGAVGMYSGIFNNPFIIWGKYERKWLKYTLNLSFQFHHTQMDGAHAVDFLERLQNEIRKLRI